MLELLNELRSTSSSNEKIAILNRNRDMKYLQSAIKLCYDPYTNFYINKLPSYKSACQEGDNFYQAFPEFLELANNLSQRKITGNAAREAVDDFMLQCDYDTRSIFSCILKKDLKCGCGSTTFNKIWPGLIKEFEVQLANKYNKDRDYGVDKWWASPKMDGIRCVATFKDGNVTLSTRSGKAIIGFVELERELSKIFTMFPVQTMLDGELYSHSLDFQTIQGFVLKNKNINEKEKKQIQYNVFAMLVQENWPNTSQMVKALEDIDRSYKFNYVTFVKYTLVDNDYDDISSITQKFFDEGYEGVMLRHPHNAYSWKRDDNLLKFKPFIESDFQIIGTEEGDGKFEGTLGAIIVEGDYEDKHIVANVGSGLSDVQRSLFFNDNSLIGNVAEVKFQGITDKTNEHGN